MKNKLFYSMLIVLTLFVKSHAAENVAITYMKQYVEPAQINILPDAIEVNIEGNLMPVNGLFADQNGIYVVYSKDATEVRVPVGTWQCPRCLRINSIFKSTCQWCKWPD